jgi:hypothetical protein
MNRRTTLALLCCCAVFALVGCAAHPGPTCTTTCIGTIPPPSNTGAGGVPQPPPATVAPPANIYLLNIALPSGETDVVTVPLGGTGTVDTSLYLADPGIQLSSLTSDSSGHFYAFESGSTPAGPYGDILEFGASGSGAFTPLRRISQGSFSSTLSGPFAVDAAGDIAVTTDNAIDIFGPTANGISTPARSIALATTATGPFPMAMAFDKNGTLYLLQLSSSSAYSILVFDSSANGNVAPTRTLTLPSVSQGSPYSLSLDNAGNLYVIASSFTDGPNGVVTGALYNVSEYAPGAAGNAAPIATMTSPTSQYAAETLSFDSTGALYLLVQDLQANVDVLKFSAMTNGPATPEAVLITGPGPGLLDPSMVVTGP